MLSDYKCVVFLRYFSCQKKKNSPVIESFSISFARKKRAKYFEQLEYFLLIYQEVRQ